MDLGSNVFVHGFLAFLASIRKFGGLRETQEAPSNSSIGPKVNKNRCFFGIMSISRVFDLPGSQNGLRNAQMIHSFFEDLDRLDAKKNEDLW